MTDVGPRPVIADARIAAFLAEKKRLPADCPLRLHLAEPNRGQPRFRVGGSRRRWEPV